MTERKTAKTFVKAATAVALSVALAGCMGWVPGRQSYWDAKVKEMCEKDGGVQILEVLRISKFGVSLLGKADGMIDVPMESLADPNSPAYAVNKLQVLREGNPAVWRSEWEITRRSDHAIVARTVSYTRSGGDIPSPAHESRFTCPDPKKMLADLQRLFVVEDDTK
jgi:hypothetical protein